MAGTDVAQIERALRGASDHAAEQTDLLRRVANRELAGNVLQAFNVAQAAAANELLAGIDRRLHDLGFALGDVSDELNEISAILGLEYEVQNEQRAIQRELLDTQRTSLRLQEQTYALAQREGECKEVVYQADRSVEKLRKMTDVVERAFGAKLLHDRLTFEYESFDGTCRFTTRDLSDISDKRLFDDLLGQLEAWIAEPSTEEKAMLDAYWNARGQLLDAEAQLESLDPPDAEYISPPDLGHLKKVELPWLRVNNTPLPEEAIDHLAILMPRIRQSDRRIRNAYNLVQVVLFCTVLGSCLLGGFVAVVSETAPPLLREIGAAFAALLILGFTFLGIPAIIYAAVLASGDRYRRSQLVRWIAGWRGVDVAQQDRDLEEMKQITRTDDTGKVASVMQQWEASEGERERLLAEWRAKVAQAEAAYRQRIVEANQRHDKARQDCYARRCALRERINALVDPVNAFLDAYPSCTTWHPRAQRPPRIVDDLDEDFEEFDEDE